MFPRDEVRRILSVYKMAAAAIDTVKLLNVETLGGAYDRRSLRRGERSAAVAGAKL